MYFLTKMLIYLIVLQIKIFLLDAQDTMSMSELVVIFFTV